jgi:hypothetical protein
LRPVCTWPRDVGLNSLQRLRGSTPHGQADGPISFQAPTKPKNREKRNECFVMRNERFRIPDTKSLKSLRAPNQGFRGIVCFQALNRLFVSRFRRMHSLDPKRVVQRTVEQSQKSARR